MNKKEKYIIIIQARLASKRFPAKILKKIKGVSAIEFLIRRLKNTNFSKSIWIATTLNPADDVLVNKLKKKI